MNFKPGGLEEMGKIGNLQWNPDFSNLYGKVNKLVRENEVRLNGSTIIYIKKKTKWKDLCVNLQEAKEMLSQIKLLSIRTVLD